MKNLLDKSTGNNCWIDIFCWSVTDLRFYKVCVSRGGGHRIQFQTEFAIKSKFSIGSDTCQFSLDGEPPDDEGNDVVVNWPFR